MIPIIIACIASSGLWTFLYGIIANRSKKKDAISQMLVGLGHDRICDLGSQYIKRGYITKDEYENLVDYLFIPYKLLGGNGTAEKIIQDVSKLEMR